MDKDFQDEIDRQMAYRWFQAGVTIESIRACREYEKIHGKFYEWADMRFCHKVALDWFLHQKQEEKNEHKS